MDGISSKFVYIASKETISFLFWREYLILLKGSSEDDSHYCVLRKYKTSTKRWRWHRFNQQRQDLLLSISVLNSKSISILVKTVHHTCKICSGMDKWPQQGWLCEALSIYLWPCFTYHAFNIIPSYLLRNIHFRHTTQDWWSHVPSLYLRLLLQFNLLMRKKMILIITNLKIEIKSSVKF